MKNLALHWKILIGMVLGIIWALLSSSMGWSSFTINWIDPFGTIFINLLKLIAVPLVLFSIIGGVANIGDPKSLGRMGGKTLLIYLTTTVFAISLGLILVNTVKPGKLIDEQSRIDNRINYEIWAASQGHTIKDGINYLHDPAFFKRAQEITELTKSDLKEVSVADKLEKAEKQKNTSPLQPLIDIVPDNFFYSLSNNGLMLQIIFFAIFFGVCVLFIPEEQSKPVLNLVNGVNEVFLKMVDLVMQAAPFFVFALLAGVVSKMAGDDIGKVVEIFKGLSWYSLTVLVGLLLMIFVVYPLIMKTFVKKIPYTGFFKAMSPAQTLAFSTSSSAATLPVTMECVEENVGVSNKISSFVLPLGATVNMNGTALYECAAAMFLAQAYGLDLTFGVQFSIVFIALLTSVGVAGVPSASLVAIAIILGAVGLPMEAIGVLLVFDRVLDMARTSVNIFGDACCATIVARLNGEKTNLSF